MSLRWKFSLIAAAIAATAALAASTVGYVATRSQLLGQIDSSITDRARVLAGEISGVRVQPDGEEDDFHGSPPPGPAGLPAPGRNLRDDFGGPHGARLFIAQTIRRNGTATALDGVVIPIEPDDLTVAARADVGDGVSVRDVDLAGHRGRVRVAILPVPGFGAVQVARSVAETDSILDDLRTRLLLITLMVIVIAIAVALLLARRATSSLEHLTDTAESVARTGRPDARIEVSGSDEIGRLGRALSQMLASLARSQEQQQRLVQDAGHELRTPLTSLRTNIAVLDRFDRLDGDQRSRLIADLASETTEMSTLVDELVELAIGGDDEAIEPVDLERLARRAAQRAERRSGRSIVLDSGPVTLEGRPRALERAVSNLLDNAIKFDTTGGPIELSVSPGRIEVSDRGPGIPTDELALVFERFHRSVEARNVPGSGLGLAIVGEVAKAHGGTVYALRREGGGATVGFTFGANANAP